MFCKRCNKSLGENIRKGKLYCSRECKTKDCKKRNFHWKRKPKKNPYKSYETYREIVLSFLGNKCMICNSNKRLQIHHVIPRFLGGDNNHNNIKLLCEDCHQELHKNEHSK